MSLLKKRIEAIDLFCGAGGLSFGLGQAGVKVLAGIDIDPACAYPFESNNKATFVKESVSNVSGLALANRFSGDAIRLLAGCAPCQPFSTHNRGKDTSGDEKWGLLYQFSRIAEELSPELITMENVPNLRGQSVFKDFVKKLEALSYNVSHKIVDCPKYGMPQRRRRLVLLASKLGPISLIRETHTEGQYESVRNAISKLSPLDAGQSDKEDALHKARSLTPLNLSRIRNSIPGGSWLDWPESLRAPCHQREGGASFKSVYSRMTWDEPSPTITTQCFNFGTGRFGHPEQDRAITLREAALLQTFPRTYKFTPDGKDVHFSTVGRLIGNAVPPRLGEIIGISLLEHIGAYG
jgi:DNA (cytosine-5)-methyltransferase 1